MYYNLGFEKNIENIAALATVARAGTVPKSRQDLKQGYVDYIRQTQPHALLADEVRDAVRRITRREEKSQLAKAFFAESRLNDLNQNRLIEDFDHPLEDEMNPNFEEALAFLAQRAPKIKALFDLAFNYYFFAHSSKAAGGSTSGGLGVLWLNPRREWSMQDFCEIIVHELTHQLLFIDERRFRHYRDYKLMNQSDSFAYSTILNKSRPLDKVVHSYFVGHNVLRFRETLFGAKSVPYVHPTAEKIRTSLERTLGSFTDLHKTLMTDRLLILIESAKESLNAARTA